MKEGPHEVRGPWLNEEQNTEKKNIQHQGDSLVVTDPTTSPALTDLSMGERTGSQVFQWVWSYVSKGGWELRYEWTLGVISDVSGHPKISFSVPCPREAAHPGSGSAHGRLSFCSGFAQACSG